MGEITRVSRPSGAICEIRECLVVAEGGGGLRERLLLAERGGSLRESLVLAEQSASARVAPLAYSNLWMTSWRPTSALQSLALTKHAPKLPPANSNLYT